MITPEQVADLQPGDIVEYSGHPDLRGATLRGPLHLGDSGHLCIADYVVRRDDGQPSTYRIHDLTLTVVSRSPRPLYVNHPRTEPVAGDVVRATDDAADERVWWFLTDGGRRPWLVSTTGGCYKRGELPERLRLLVDGETGEVVP